MSDDLRDILRELLRSGDGSNLAFDRMLDDYARYHAVLVAIGGLFAVMAGVAAVVLWRRSRALVTAPRSFERTTYRWFALLGVMVALGLGLVVVANLGNALHPREGFAGVVDALGPPTSAPAVELRQAFDEWIASGSTTMPAFVRNRIDARLAWQRPKAIISGVLLLVGVLLAMRVWRALIDASRRSAARTARERALLVVGFGSVGACLVLAVMVIGNTQASLAPIVLTLQFG